MDPHWKLLSLQIHMGFFMSRCGIYPQIIGQAEYTVQTIKQLYTHKAVRCYMYYTLLSYWATLLPGVDWALHSSWCGDYKYQCISLIIRWSPSGPTLMVSRGSTNSSKLGKRETSTNGIECRSFRIWLSQLYILFIFILQLHPGTRLQWRKCADAPVWMSRAQIVVIII